MIKAVIDANVWIGAVAANGVCRSVIEAFKQDLFTVIYPTHLLSELSDVFQRRKFKHINPDLTSELLRLIQLKAILISIPPEYSPSVSLDPKDNPYLACAYIANCDFIVTGDEKHLLCLESYEQTKIISPAQFLNILKQK